MKTYNAVFIYGSFYESRWVWFKNLFKRSCGIVRIEDVTMEEGKKYKVYISKELNNYMGRYEMVFKKVVTEKQWLVECFKNTFKPEVVNEKLKSQDKKET